jgi:serine/threonine protein kinase
MQITSCCRFGNCMCGAKTARRLSVSDAVLQGMLHLHLCDPPIIHRDLKSPNLLVDKHWKLKVRHALPF